jgi:hypothetical protein
LSQLNVPKLNRQFALAWKTRQLRLFARRVKRRSGRQTFSDVGDPAVSNIL